MYANVSKTLSKLWFVLLLSIIVLNGCHGGIGWD